MTLSTPNARNHETGAVERATRDLPNEVFYAARTARSVINAFANRAPVISTRHAKATASGSRDEFLDSTLELFLDLNPLLRLHAS